MQLTDELRVIVEAEVNRAIQNFEKLNTSIDKNEKKTKSFSDALDTFSGKATVISAALAAAGVAAVKFAGNLEQTQIALEVLLGDAEKASQIKNEWTQLAANTPFSSSDIDSAGKKLLAFNIEADKVTETLRRIGDISAATGSSISDIADIYGKAAVQGRLFAEDINQFQGRGIPVIQALATVLGVSETAVRDLVSEGKVGFPELEKAFNLMTDEGGQFAGMMDRLSESTLGRLSSTLDNAELALASFGEVMLDSVNDALAAGDDFFRWLQNMDDGTKRFIVTLGGVAAAAGPAVIAIKGIAAAMAVLAANPIILGAVGVTAGIALIAAAVNKANHQLEDSVSSMERSASAADSLFSSFEGLSAEQSLNEQQVASLLEIYPELSGTLSAYTTTVAEAKEAVKELNREQAQDAAEKSIEKLRKQQEVIAQTEKGLEEAAGLYNEGVSRLSKMLYEGQIDQAWYDTGVANLDRQYGYTFSQNRLKKLQGEYTKFFHEVNAQLNRVGFRLTDNLTIQELPDLTPPALEEIPPETITDTLESSLDAAAPDAMKTWQEWFAEITGVDAALFDTGKEAGAQYVQGMSAALAQTESIAQALGTDFDLHTIVRSQMEQIESDIAELLSVPADEIDEQFSLVDDSVRRLIESYHELAEADRNLTVTDTLDELRSKVDALGKSEADLTLEMLAANGATAEQLAEAEYLLSQLNQSTDGVISWQEALTQVFEESLNKLGLYNEQTTSIFANIGTQIASLTFDSLLTGLSEVGKALAQGENASKSLQDALAAMAQQILSQLPTMFLQAGLQLIAQGQWALGLGLIAAAGVTALMSGGVEGYLENAENEEEEKNAKGSVYGDAGYSTFAKGGAFTNSIVTSPTYFRFARGAKFGTGLMGEAGPEAIMPLTRTSDGSLGVAVTGSAGGNGALTVIINNYSSQQVQAQETTGQDGERQLEIMIGSLINKHLSSGKADKAMGSRYGLKNKGV